VIYRKIIGVIETHFCQNTIETNARKKHAKGENIVNNFERNVVTLATMSCGWLALSGSPRYSLLYERTHVPSVCFCANTTMIRKEVLFSSLDNVLVLSTSMFVAEAVRNIETRATEIYGPRMAPNWFAYSRELHMWIYDRKLIC